MLVFDNLIEQYLLNNDLIGFIIAIYTSVLGQLFYGVLVMIITVPLYMRTQSLSYVTILWILMGTLIETVLPIAVFNIGHVLIVLGIAGLLYKLFTSERG